MDIRAGLVSLAEQRQQCAGGHESQEQRRAARKRRRRAPQGESTTAKKQQLQQAETAEYRDLAPVRRDEEHDSRGQRQDAADTQHGCEELPPGLRAGPRRGEFEKSVDAGGIEPVVPGDLVQLSSRRLSLHWRRSIRACRRTPAI